MRMIRGYSSTSLRNPDCLCSINSLKYWLLIQYPIQYMSREEIERLLFSFTADTKNDEAVAFEALARRLLSLLEKAVDS